jgi:hypothetical protein
MAGHFQRTGYLNPFLFVDPLNNPVPHPSHGTGHQGFNHNALLKEV